MGERKLNLFLFSPDPSNKRFCILTINIDKKNYKKKIREIKRNDS